MYIQLWLTVHIVASEEIASFTDSVLTLFNNFSSFAGKLFHFFSLLELLLLKFSSTSVVGHRNYISFVSYVALQSVEN